MPNPLNESLDLLLEHPFRVLGGAGFVRLVGYYGTDATVVQAARVSYGEGTKTVREDQGLINYLLRNAHSSPFEQCNMTWHIKQPIFCERQMGRHRTARRNEISGRYSVMRDEFYLPGATELRAQGKRNKQVGEGALPERDATIAADDLARQAQVAYAEYEGLLERGVSREQARMVLPQNLLTEGYWQFDWSNLMKMLALRLDAHAQAEIREIAEVMFAHFCLAAPLTSAAFKEYVLHAANMSRSELKVITRWHELLLSRFDPHFVYCTILKDMREDRYAQEFLDKLAKSAQDYLDDDVSDPTCETDEQE